MLVATLLGVGSNAGFLWPVYEYGQESTRGATELTKKGHSTGLDKDYVFAFSYEKGETFSLMFPNFYGGTQAKSFYNQEGSTETALALRNPNVAKQLGALAGDRAGRYLTQYRGSQSMCGGPIYYGVVAFFLEPRSPRPNLNSRIVFFNLPNISNDVFRNHFIFVRFQRQHVEQHIEQYWIPLVSR